MDLREIEEQVENGIEFFKSNSVIRGFSDFIADSAHENLVAHVTLVTEE